MANNNVKTRDVTNPIYGLCGLKTFEAEVYDRTNKRYISSLGSTREQAVENLLEKLAKSYQER